MGDLLGQTELLLTRQEEADRPGAGVGGGAALLVVVHLIGGSEATVQGSCWGLQFWAQWPPVELLLNADRLPTAGQAPFLCDLSQSPQHREVRAMEATGAQRGEVTEVTHSQDANPGLLAQVPGLLQYIVLSPTSGLCLSIQAIASG